MYFCRSSRHSCVSGIGDGRSPRSRTGRPRRTSRSARPAMRIAEGPMSTPRRLPPKSSGTPMMWTGFMIHLSPYLDRDRHPLVPRFDDRGEQPWVIVDRVEKITHFGLLVHHVVGEKKRARLEARQDEIEKSFVVPLPRVEKHEVYRAGHFRNLLKRIAGNDGHDVSEAGAPDVLGGASGACEIVFDGGQPAAGLPEPQT